MRAVRVEVPAKINLVLSVGPRRADGYHDLATVFMAVSLYDVVTASPAGELELTVDGRHQGRTPGDHTNLAVRAVEALATRAGVRSGVRLTLSKEIPVAAGLAGGSADAAATLLACAPLWGFDASMPELAEVAASIGSDVPFALAGGTALGRGRGELLDPIVVGAPLHWVLAVADDGLSTPLVFDRLDRLRAGAEVAMPAVEPAVLDALSGGDPSAVGPLLHNDLQPAALELRPGLADLLAAGRAAGALGGVLSGSGPTCAFLAIGASHAASIAAELSQSGTCASAHAVVGPVTPVVDTGDDPRA